MAILHLLTMVVCAQFVLCSSCSSETNWEESQPNYIQVRECDTGFVYRICNSFGEWEPEMNESCVCSSGDFSCSKQVYNNVQLQYTPEIPYLLSSIPQDMDMTVPTLSTISLTFSQPGMQWGGGKGYVETDLARIDLSESKVSCALSTCTITLDNTLPTNQLALVRLDLDFVVSSYHLSLDHPVTILFKTIPIGCDTHMISEGFGNSEICSCSSDNNSCTCNCGDTSINRVF